jgi:hypothetical protein
VWDIFRTFASEIKGKKSMAPAMDSLMEGGSGTPDVTAHQTLII